MNLVQLSEQLKDVPDSFLQNEVTNPTGAYPAYLVVSELTRRKRMRDNVAKQEPSTTVAEDVMGLNAIPQAMQSLAAQDVAMAGPPQQMPRQPQRMPMPPRPQPQPQQMAEGGLVAFGNGGGVMIDTNPQMKRFGDYVFEGKEVLQDEEGRDYVDVQGGRVYKDGPIYIDTIAGPQNELEPFQPPVKSQFEEMIGPRGQAVVEDVKKSGRSLLDLPGRLMDRATEFFSTDPKAVEEAQESLAERLKRIQGKKEEGIRGVGTATFGDESGKQRTFDEYLESREAMRKRLANNPQTRDAVLRSIEGYRIGDVPVQPDGAIAESDRVLKPMEKSSNIISTQAGRLTGLEKLNIDKPKPEQKEVGNAPDENNPEITKIGQASKLKLQNLKSSFKTDLDNINRINKDISEFLSKGKAPDDLYQEGVDKYKKEIKNPLKFLKDEIQKEEKRIEKLKFDNLNDALIQAGAAILQSPGGQSLQWLGKGLEGFQKAYKKGREDIVDAKKDLLQSRIAFAESENDYARGAEEAGLRSLQKGEAFQKMGLQKLGTEKALFAENINTALSIAQAESGIGLDSAKAYYYRNPQLRTSGIEGELTAKQQEMVYNEVRRDMADYANRMNLTPSDPRYAAEENRLLDEKTRRIMLRNRGIYGAGLNEPRVIDVSGAFESQLAP